MTILGCLCLFCIQVTVVFAGNPWCFECADAFHPAVCQNVVTCGDHESCYTELHTSNNGGQSYTSGCKPTVDCQRITKRDPTVICEECCKTTGCNENKCKAQALRPSNRLWCAICQYKQDPTTCDQVFLCPVDNLCSIHNQTRFNLSYYQLKCETPLVCKGKTMAQNRMQCCKEDLCNSNLALVSPDVYIPPTTTPAPSMPTAHIDNKTVEFVTQQNPNETLTIVCHVDGLPLPNVTWTFIPDVNYTSGAGNLTSATTKSVSAASSSETTVVTTTATTVVTSAGVTNKAATGSNTTGTSATATTILASAGVTNKTATSSNTTGTSATTIAGISTTSGASSTVSTSGIGSTIQPLGIPLTTGITTSGDTSTLVITTPDLSNAGVYVCHAKNVVGSAEDNTTVEIKAAPTITGPHSVTIKGKVHDDLLLNCEVNGNPTPDIEWLYDPKLKGGIEKLANGSILIHNAHTDNNGRFICAASNKVGRTAKLFTVHVDDPYAYPASASPHPAPAGSETIFSSTTPH